MKPESKNEKYYERYLPSVLLHETKDKTSFLEGYLRIFECILSGIEESELNGKKGLEKMIDAVDDLFYPEFSFLYKDNDIPAKSEIESFNQYFSTDMDEFLAWFAGWISLVLKKDWDFEKKREMIKKIIPIYKKRGTKKGLEEYLQLLEGKNVNIVDEDDSFQVGIHSHVGINTRIGGPYFFVVNIEIPEYDLKNIRDKRRALEELINKEKPVHTDYLLYITAIYNKHL